MHFIFKYYIASPYATAVASSLPRSWLDAGEQP
jgi:hypothetical protein